MKSHQSLVHPVGLVSSWYHRNGECRDSAASVGLFRKDTEVPCRSITETERNAQKLEEVYVTKCNEFAEDPDQDRNIALQSNNVDVNLLAWLEVFSRGRQRQFRRNEHTAQIQAETKSGALIIQELWREQDLLTPADRRMFISDISWQGYIPATGGVSKPAK